jgi:hypothetical protein
VVSSLPTSPSAGVTHLSRLQERVRSLSPDRTTRSLIAVFLFGSALYFWRASLAEPLALHGGAGSPYNQLADAFLHFHLWVLNFPKAALGAGNPYNPAERPAFLFSYPDYSLYSHYLYITWGPAPVLVLLVPLHLLGFEPSASVMTAPFAIVGLGFALATLRVILRQIGTVRLWMSILAALTLTCASVIPYVVRFPLVYHEAIAGGYCFAMAGIWCGASAVVNRHASAKRLAFMSLCIGLATDSRPTLALLALLLVAVYLSLRPHQSRRRLGVALSVPFGVCALLLAAYNQARFNSPFEYGTKYQINGPSTYTAHFGELSFLPPGLWSYLLTPPRLGAIFPFFLINYPQESFPFTQPAHYGPLSEETGGLLAMAPIAIFLVVLPWLWRRRSSSLGPLVPFLCVMGIAGVICMASLAYEFYISTERYEADYMTLFLFGALAVWLALSSGAGGAGRRLIRLGGAMLAAWSCLTGVAMSYQEIEAHYGDWHTLVSLGAPLSTVIAAIAGHPILAEVYTPNIERSAPNYGDLGTEVTGFSLTAGSQANITIVSPSSRSDALIADTSASAALQAGGSPEVRVSGPGRAVHTYRLPGGGAQARIPLQLASGVNQIVISPAPIAAGQARAAQQESEAEPLISFKHITLASH